MIAKPLQPDIRDDSAQIAPNPARPAAQTTRRFVALRTKTLALLVLTMIGLLIALYIPLRLIVLGSFLDLEAQTTRTEVERANNALHTAIGKLDNSASGYATWDDTYAFVQDRDSNYLEVNLAEPSFPAEDINLVVIVNNSGQIAGAKAYDLDQQHSIPVPEFFLQPSDCAQRTISAQHPRQLDNRIRAAARRADAGGITADPDERQAGANPRRAADGPLPRYYAD